LDELRVKKGKETGINKKRKGIRKCTLKEKEKDKLQIRIKRAGKRRRKMW